MVSVQRNKKTDKALRLRIEVEEAREGDENDHRGSLTNGSYNRINSRNIMKMEDKNT